MKPDLLLHCCCAPCSSAILEYLSDYYNITLYFYNPNITDVREYNQRADEVARLVKSMELSNINIVVEEFDPEPFLESTKGLENEPECGKRCKVCYLKRLQKTAEYGVANGFKEFSTTLTISPYKNSATINELGILVGQANKIQYMSFDFGFLYARSLDLCEYFGLYQQDYCGCEYSKK